MKKNFVITKSRINPTQWEVNLGLCTVLCLKEDTMTHTLEVWGHSMAPYVVQKMALNWLQSQWRDAKIEATLALPGENSFEHLFYLLGAIPYSWGACAEAEE